MRFKFSLIILLCGLMSGALSAQVIEAEPPPPPPPPPPTEEVFKVVENMPRFPGCEEITDRQERKMCSQQKMLEYIYKNITYPKLAIENGVEGMAVISFVVAKNGTLENIKILRDPGAGTGQAAATVVQKMNIDKKVWTPGMMRGKAVPVQFNLPVRFKLPEDQKPDSPIEEETAEDVGIEMSEPTPPRTAAEPSRQQPVFIPDDALDPSPKPEVNEAPPPPPPMPEPVRTRELSNAPSRTARDRNNEVEVVEDSPPRPEAVFNAPPPPPPPPPRESEVFVVVEDMPRFKQENCETLSTKQEKKTCAQDAMLDFIYENLQYPPIAKENGIEGTCVITFNVNTNGSLSDIRVIRDIGAGCGQEGVRLVELMSAQGSWITGKQRGRPVVVKYNLPIKFKMED